MGPLRVAALVLLLGAACASGCVSLIRVKQGSAPDASTVAGLQKGATLAEVLTLCGAPVEAVAQPDGLLLIYRERRYDLQRIGFDPSRGLGAVDASGVVANALGNLKLIIEWGEMVESRLVVLFDRDERVVAFAYRDEEGDLR